MENTFDNLIVDIDGSFLDTEQGINQSLRDTILQYPGEEVEPDGLSRYFAMSSNEALKDLGIVSIEEPTPVWNRL